MSTTAPQAAGTITGGRDALGRAPSADATPALATVWCRSVDSAWTLELRGLDGDSALGTIKDADPGTRTRHGIGYVRAIIASSTPGEPGAPSRLSSPPHQSLGTWSEASIPRSPAPIVTDQKGDQAMSTAISSLIAAGSRFPVSTGQPDTDEELSPIHLRSFLLRGAESIHSSPYADGATPKATTGYDGTRDDQSEEFNQPDFSP